MADCDNIAVDLAPIDFDVTICSTPAFDVEIIQPDVTLEAISIAGQGPKGDKGDQGDQGVPGTPGAVGAPGSPGTAANVSVGTTTTGAPGTAANVTDSDPSGNAILNFTIPRGDVGATGPMGQGILIKGSVPNHASLPATGNTPGDVWVTSDTSHGWAWTGTAWVDIGPIQGPPGQDGVAGQPGPPGSAGAPGAAGAAATVAAGTTTTSAPGTNAAVINTGSSSAAIFAFTIPRGDVGQQGPAGVAGAPGSIGIDGAPGAAGKNAWTLVTNASFTVPAYGGNVTVQAGDTSWVALGEWIYVDDAGGPGVAGQLVVTAKTPTTLTLFNPTPTTYPLASTSTDGLLRKVSGNTTDFVDGTNNCQTLIPQITSVRLRSYNSLGNPNFEVDQRNCNTGLSYIAGNVSAFQCDRWLVGKNAATATGTAAANASTSAGTILPGTNFRIGRGNLAFTVGISQASLAASDYLMFTQNVEGPQWRELSGDVHSLSLLVQSSIASFPFSVSIRSQGGAYSLVLPCVSGPANTYTLITLPNLPLWTASATWSNVPGVIAYTLGICLGAGSTYTTATTGSWIAGNFLGYSGQPNFLATAGASFILGFVQHEPGSVCTTLQDKPFSQSLDECQRMYTKSYNYAVKPGTVDASGCARIWVPASGSPAAYIPFKKVMAKPPATVTAYSSVSGTANAVRDETGATDRLTSGGGTAVGESGFSGFTLQAVNSSASFQVYHYTADTGM